MYRRTIGGASAAAQHDVKTGVASCIAVSIQLIHSGGWQDHSRIKTATVDIDGTGSSSD
ncbi:hypothetical protein D3C86_2210550 [compost metagenome]